MASSFFWGWRPVVGSQIKALRAFLQGARCPAANPAAVAGLPLAPVAGQGICCESAVPPFPVLKIETMTKIASTLFLVLLIAGCYQPDETRAVSWTKPDATQDIIYDDLASCREQASAMIERDAAIDSDIDAGMTSADPDSTALDLERNMDASGSEKRFRRLINDCMRGRGYALADGE
ncbi:MAG: hypothetical protein SGJ07_10605 [Rhodospirillaceae bacterium]|nr:hypothetical protein [Rhodospirillaceae bacterium]